MDWRERARLDAMRDPTEGTLQVVAISSSPEVGDRVDGIHLTGVIRVDGLPPTAVEYRGDARPVQWPQRGQLLPVVVDRASPTHAECVIVDWDRVPTHLELAEQLAEQLRREADSEQPPGVGQSDGI
ncbi:MAG: hypothetical protein J2P38_01140 [Candidatus Dormibacteraeota bacterium]|nr:hypothetical protein [Candidatus Dormibacteraeota bacterium]